MERYIALLRGINVSGQKKILMTDLRSLFESIGFTGVETYIQSGNVVFSSKDIPEPAERIGEAILAAYGWEVPVLVVGSSELLQILDSCPFPKQQKEQSYFVLFSGTPDPEGLKFLESVDQVDEKFSVGENCIYLYCPNGYGRAKLNNNFFERKLRLTATTRNHKTLVKLLEMASL